MRFRCRNRVFAVCFLGIAAFSAAAGSAVFTGCSSGMTQFRHSTEEPLETVSVETAFEKKEAGVYFLDIREQCEWEEARIPGAAHIPLGRLEKSLDAIPRDREIVVVCRSGARSRIGLQVLRREGFDKSTSMDGGLNAWTAAGYPVESGGGR